MIDPEQVGREFENLKSPQERRDILANTADSIRFEKPENFQDLDIDYSQPFPKFKKELLKRIRSGKNDVIVIVQWGQEGSRFAMMPLVNTERLEFLLGKRVEGRIYGGTWAPIMGKIEESDLAHTIVKRPVKIPRNLSQFKTLIEILRTWRPPRFGEFIGYVPGMREQREEILLWPTLSGFDVARPYLDKESDRIVHVLVQSAVAASGSGDEGLFSDERGTHLKYKQPERDREHSEIRWFNLKDLRLDQMADGTKKAMKNALLRLAEVQV